MRCMPLTTTQAACLCECSIHVASVVQMTHLLLHQGGVAKIMNEPQLCATYYAALTHDFEHLGVNNDYLIKSFHPLAVMYNDISPLENHHLAAAFRVMQRPECRYTKVSTAAVCSQKCCSAIPRSTCLLCHRHLHRCMLFSLPSFLQFAAARLQLPMPRIANCLAPPLHPPPPP